jgi:DNA repair protein RadC
MQPGTLGSAADMENILKNIKELSLADRPREKLIQLGPNVLSNAELVAIILGSGTTALPLVVISKSLIDSIGNNIANMGAMSIEQIAKIKGIGEIKAVSLLAAIELGKRSLQQAPPLSLKNDNAVEELISTYLTTENIAQYHLVLMNDRQELLASSKLETEKGKLPDLKAMIKLSLEAGAAEMMLCRNDIKLPARFCDHEKAFIIQLDAAASMLKIKMRGLLVIKKRAVPH